MRHRGLVLLVLVVGCGKVVEEKPDAKPPSDGTTGGSDAALDGPIDAALDAAIDAAPSDIPAGAALWLRFDDSPTDGSTDSAGTHSVTCTSCPAQVTGHVGGAYQFTSGNRVSTIGADLGPKTAFTIAMWVRADQDNTSLGLIACKELTNSSDCSYGFLHEAMRIPCFYHTSGNHQHAMTALPIGEWHHLAMTWNGMTKLGYVDGVQAITLAATTIGVDDALPLSFGNYTPGSYPFLGSIDDVVFYNRALTVAEITQLANR